MQVNRPDRTAHRARRWSSESSGGWAAQCHRGQSFLPRLRQAHTLEPRLFGARNASLENEYASNALRDESGAQDRFEIAPLTWRDKGMGGRQCEQQGRNNPSDHGRHDT